MNPTLLKILTDSSEEMKQTHLSWVFLRKHTVLKVKKSVAFQFVDFSQLAQRKEACEQELVLNRRLAPHVYLQTLPLSCSEAGKQLIVSSDSTEGLDPALQAAGEAAEVEEWGVLMRRLRDDDNFDSQLRQGKLTLDSLLQLARRLAEFHQQCSTGTMDDGFAVVRRLVEENFEEAGPLLTQLVSPDQHRQLEKFQRSFLETHRGLFLDRIKRKCIVDGHGDLRLEHIYSQGDAPPFAIDCIEFSPLYRIGDRAADIAFVAMDLARLGKVSWAERFVAEYAQQSDDYDLYSVLDFYWSYRAYVRAKVSVLSMAGGTPTRRRQLSSEARLFFREALRSGVERPARPQLFAVAGGIGSGKSTVSAWLGDRLNAPVISSDRTRKRLLKVPIAQSVQDQPYCGAYDPTVTTRVYEAVLQRAAAVLQSGRSVIVDASFQQQRYRQQASDLAAQWQADFALIECRADRDTILQRLAKRHTQACESDAREDLYETFTKRFEPIAEMPAERLLRLNTGQPKSATAEQLDHWCAQRQQASEPSPATILPSE